MLLLLLAKAHQVRGAYRVARRRLSGFWPGLRAAIRHVLGPAGALLVTEAEVLRSAVLGWWTPAEVPTGAQGFSTYRESGFSAFAVMLGVALVVEAGVVHLLVGHWYPVAANWLLLFDGYSLLLLLAHGQAVRRYPVLLTETGLLHLRVGGVWRLRVPLRQLVAVELLRDTPPPAAGRHDLTKLLFTPPNLLLTFARPVTVRGLYGLRRTGHQLAIYVDQPHRFAEAARPAAT